MKKTCKKDSQKLTPSGGARRVRRLSSLGQFGARFGLRSCPPCPPITMCRIVTSSEFSKRSFRPELMKPRKSINNTSPSACQSNDLPMRRLGSAHRRTSQYGDDACQLPRAPAYPLQTTTGIIRSTGCRGGASAKSPRPFQLSCQGDGHIAWCRFSLCLERVTPHRAGGATACCR